VSIQEDCPNLSQERVKLRTSNLYAQAQSEQKPIKNFWKSSCGRSAKFFRAAGHHCNDPLHLLVRALIQSVRQTSAHQIRSQVKQELIG